MNIALHGSTVSLESNRVMTLRDASGSTVRCLDGALWITERRSALDVILGPGESFTLTRDGLTVVTALENATVRLCERRRSRLPTWVAELKGWFDRQRGSIPAS